MKEAAYKGFSIVPFTPFTKTDYYSYDAEPIGNDEPLIYDGENCDIVISGSKNDNVSIQVFVGDDGDLLYYGDTTLPKALRLGKAITDKDTDSLDDLVEFLDNESGLEYGF